MNLIPYKKLTFESRISKEEFQENVIANLQFSKSKNWLTATTNDYLITGTISNQKFSLENKHRGRNPLWYKINGEIEANGITKVHVRITPKPISVLCSALFLLVFMLTPFSFTIKGIFAGLFYFMIILYFRFVVWWVEDLFKRRLLKNNSQNTGG